MNAQLRDWMTVIPRPVVPTQMGLLGVSAIRAFQEMEPFVKVRLGERVSLFYSF